MALIGKHAPEWRATAYQNGEEVQIASADYRGKWYVLYWYPLDFTFVCPTEIRGFQSMLGDFRAEGVEVIGASTDSFFSHKQWFADRKTFAEEITHPVIADTNHAVSRAFDVLEPNQGVAFRATVIIDDRGVVRSLSANDLSVGRSPAEVLRTVQALKSGGLCAADWKKGDAFVG
jgi:peroxiredoxin (alkyl hydroperoxide reductase subunit C)